MVTDASAAPMKAGVVGCGNISSVYFENLGTRYSNVEVIACADLEPAKARASADRFGVPAALTMEQLIAEPDVELLINLTNPGAHADVSMAALEAGKQVYSEKPLSVERADGRAIMDLAEAKGLAAGCAPDTVLGSGIQTCRKIIDEGRIGEPVAATAFMMSSGHESWHPSPEFFYRTGGGPLFDMGPYYLSALITLLGPVSRVTGSHRKSFDRREITSMPMRGQTIDVEVSTHVAGVLDFASGAIGTIITSFDVQWSSLPRIEVYGSEGTLYVPDPNRFDGPVSVIAAGGKGRTSVPSAFPEGDRGLGVAEMAWAVRNGRTPRVSGALALHVLDVMHAVHEASDRGAHVQTTTGCERPAAMAHGLLEGVFGG